MQSNKKKNLVIIMKIQKKICEINGINKNLTIEELAIKVIKGELGNDEERKKNLVTYIPQFKIELMK